ncbi:MAG: hypothetical protein KGL39_04770 [Patescibacteria group bacterium]|nr:hypothetical protein [Patescibacteria group bacterium]
MSGPEDFDDYLDDSPDDEDDELAEAEFNCGLMPDGTCSLAGTEWCDWDCPFSN